MSKEQHQLDEMVNAIAQVINVESVKARKEVIKIIGDGVDANNNPSDILIKVLEWCGNE
jgi:hypothetical protein